ncbi:MAG: patatin-like phospholipase family protein [Bacteroidota bacterium]
MTTRFLLLALSAILWTSCSKNIYPDRSAFFRDTDVSPSVNLEHYKSVQLRPNQDSTIAVAMCVTGGGHRAANFAVGVMMGLENIGLDGQQDVLDEVDYISTVSGGGFAGGSYLRARIDHDQNHRGKPFRFADYVDTLIRKDLSHSFMATLVGANFNPRFWFSPYNDGDALERKIDDLVLGYEHRKKYKKQEKSILLGDIFIPDNDERTVRYPWLITNTSEYFTMRILPFTPDVLAHYRVNGYSHRLRTVQSDSLDTFRVPLAVGIKASGSFPVLISNTILYSNYHPERDALHLVDGAMSDNMGYITALEVLQQEQAPQKALFVVDANSVGNLQLFSQKQRAIPSFSVLGRLSYSGIDAMRFEVYRQLTRIEERHKITPVVLGFATLIKNNDAPMPKSFKLKKTQEEMIEKLRAGFDQITDTDKWVIYELITRIATKYTIQENEQELLFLAGQLVVYLEREAILSVFNN